MKKISRIFSLLFIAIFFPTIICCGQAKSDPYKTTQITREFGDIKVIVNQSKKIIEDNPDLPYCFAAIRIYKKNVLVDSIIYDALEPVGGDYGLMVYSGLINNHLIISKYNAYDGGTVIINNKGEKFITLGGYSSVNSDSSLLFSLYASDLGGLSIFDLNKDMEILELYDLIDYPLGFYQLNEDKYYVQTEDDPTDNMQDVKGKYFQIDFKNKKLIPSEIKPEALIGKELKEFVDYRKIYTSCE